MKKTLKIVSRKSALALWQANFIKKELQGLYPLLEISVIGIQTEGDQILDTPLSKIGGKGLFVKALEECLLTHEADIAVHSLKDMPSELPDGLMLATILKREDPRDVFISSHFSDLATLPANAPIGTSSLRRQSQLYALRSDLCLKNIRGNVDTRIQKMEGGECAALILAAAGLKRLGLENQIRSYLPITQMLPAVGQGALCIECRTQDIETKELLLPLHHIPTEQCIRAERTLNAILGGGCQLPIAGFAVIDESGMLTLEGMVGSPDGRTLLKAKATAKPEMSVDIGKTVAEKLLAQGAQNIINAVYLDKPF